MFGGTKKKHFSISVFRGLFKISRRQRATPRMGVGCDAQVAPTPKELHPLKALRKVWPGSLCPRELLLCSSTAEQLIQELCSLLGCQSQMCLSAGQDLLHLIWHTPGRMAWGALLPPDVVNQQEKQVMVTDTMAITNTVTSLYTQSYSSFTSPNYRINESLFPSNTWISTWKAELGFVSKACLFDLQPQHGCPDPIIKACPAHT